MLKSNVLIAAWLLTCSPMFGASSPGSLDTNFVSVAGTDTFGNGLSMAPQNQIFVSGSFTNYGNTGRAGIVRLNANGSLDTSFTAPVPRVITPAVIVNGTVLVPASTNVGSVKSALALPDGRCVIAGNFSHLGDAPVSKLAVLSATGNPSAATFALSKIEPTLLRAGPGDTFYVGGQGNVDDTKLPLLRFRADGTQDASFTPPTLASLGYASSSCTSLLPGPGDTFYVVTAAALPSFTLTFDIVRLTSSGALDVTFADAGKANIPNPSAVGVVAGPEGKIVFNGLATYRGAALARKVNRLTLSGALDPDFTVTTELGTNARVVAVQADGKVLYTSATVALGRLNANGTADTGYVNPAKNPVAQVAMLLAFFALGPDQSLFASGYVMNSSFAIIYGVYHINGDPQTGPTVATEPVSQTITLGARARFSVAAQGGAPLSYQWTRNGAPIPGATSFDFVLDPTTAADEADYQCVVTNPQGSVSSKVVHLTLLAPSAGSVYQETDVPVGPNSSVQELRLDAAGRLLAAGGFTKWDGINRLRVARLQTLNEHVDTDFDTSASAGSLNLFDHVLPLASGKTLVVGNLTVTYGSGPHNEVLLLNANGSLDTSFNPTGSGGTGIATSLGTRPAQGADGLVVLYGMSWNDENLNGSYFRLRADGTRDPGFALRQSNYQVYGPVLAALPDGRYLVGAYPAGAASPASYSGVMRLQANGSLDPTFYTGPLPEAVRTSSLRDLLVQPDGSILVAGTFSYTQGSQTYTCGIIRLQPDGQWDPAFNPVPSLSHLGQVPVAAVWRLDRQADGRIIALGNREGTAFPRSQLFRYWPNGTLDPEFQVGTDSIPEVASLTALAVRSDNAILVGGTFTRFASLPRTNFARINAGPLSPPPAPPTISSVPLRSVVKVGSSLTLTVEPGGNGPFQFCWRRNQGPGSTHFYDIPGATNASLTLPDLKVSDSGQLQVAVVNPGGAAFSPYLTLLVEPDPAVAGTVDGSFAALNPSGLLTSLYQLTAPSPDGTVYAVLNNALVRVYEDGSRDLRFNPPPDLVPAGSGNGISAICRQSDGKLLVAGKLGSSAIARLLPDGNYDPAFVRTNQYTGGAQDLPIALGVQSTGRILVAGTFNNFDGRTVTGLVRLLSDGRFDDSFAVGTTQSVLSNPPRTLPGTIVSLHVLSGDRLYVGGGFSQISATPRHGVARLLPDGALDPSFNPPTTGSVSAGTAGPMLFYALGPVALDEGVYVFGEFLPVLNGPRYTGLRLNPDGSLNAEFHAVTDFQINTGAVQTDGKLIISGQFTIVSGILRGNLARLNRNGSLDQTFQSASTGSGVGVTLTLLSDGKLLAGGQRYFVGSSAAVEPPVLAYTLKPAGLELSWPAGFKLQQTPTLSPAAWLDVIASSPYTISPAQPSGFYRLVQGP